MKRTIVSRRVLRWLLAIAGLLLIIAWAGGFFLRKLPAGQRAEFLPGMALPAGAQVAAVVSGPVAPRVSLVGTVESRERINLSARISATVQEIFVSAGDAVAEGQLLMELDAREMEMQLAMAQAELTQAEIELRRIRELISANAATDQQQTSAQMAFDRANSAVERIRVMLTYARVHSPIDGVVTDRRVEKGDLANPGECLLAVYDPDRLRLAVPAPVRLADKLRLGQDVPVVLDQKGALTGQVAEIVSEIDPASRTQMVRIHLEEGLGGVLPGAFGRVWLEDEAREAVLAPGQAVYRVGQLEMVQVVADGRVMRRLVRTGQRHDGQAEMLSGLSGGERVLLTPVHE